MALVQWGIPMRSQNVGFSSAKIRALSGVYTDTHDDGGAALHCFLFFFILHNNLVNLCIRLLKD